VDNKTIINEVITGQEGAILNKKVLPIARGNDTLLISAAMEGCYCDNSVVGVNRSRISIFDPHTRSLIHSLVDSNLFIDAFERQGNRRIFVSAETLRQPRRVISGDFVLGPSLDLDLRNPRPADYTYGLYERLGPFSYLKELAPEINLYRGIGYIIRTDEPRTAILDTLRLENTPYRSHIVSVIDTIIYDFNLNWEMHTEYTQKNYGQDWIDSHLRLYRLSDFTLLDSIPVADYPAGDYPNQTFDMADVVGPYIVYYFFGREGLTRYAPAMLFIFDTRTNEATWLRVGWR
jgi:hypothetical protein